MGLIRAASAFQKESGLHSLRARSWEYQPDKAEGFERELLSRDSEVAALL